MFTRLKVATVVAELLGTGVLTLLVLSVQRSTIGVPFFVAIAAGLTVTVMMFSLAGSSGGHFNPAITLALWTARRVTTVTGILYIAAQFLGAWLAYALYTYFVNNTLQSVGGHYSGRILAAESVGTGLFAFTWAAAMYQRYTPAVTASVAGLGYTLGIIAASSASSAAIGLLNPALALGTRAWVLGTYVLGPVLGAIIGVNLYGLLFAEAAASPLAAAVSGGTARSSTKKNKK